MHWQVLTLTSCAPAVPSCAPAALQMLLHALTGFLLGTLPSPPSVFSSTEITWWYSGDQKNSFMFLQGTATLRSLPQENSGTE